MSKRSILTRLAILVPALVLIGALITTTMSCGGGIFPVATSSNTATPTATASAGSGSFAYVTDFNTGKVVEFARNTTAGSLTRGTIANAGAKSGPVGEAVTADNQSLFVVNSSDNNIYAYNIVNGTPAAASTTNEGSGTQPQKIAINSAETQVFVTNHGNGANGSITGWTLNSSTRQLSNKQTTPSSFGLASPFDVAIDPSGDFLYVTDNAGHTVRSFTINSDNTLSQLSSVTLTGTALATPVDLVQDPSGDNLYVTDNTNGVIWVLGINTGVLTLSSTPQVPLGQTGNGPFGIGAATIPSSSDEFLFAANFASSTIWSFPFASAGVPASPTAFGSGNVTGPKELIIDPQQLNLYTADNGDGTVAWWSINPSVCGALVSVCFQHKYATEGSSTSTGPISVVLTH